ncbi:MAG: TIGR04086 family membrane protein [Clostridiaceae bacterium]
MVNKSIVKNTIQGLLGAIIITLISIVMISIVMDYCLIPDKLISILYVIISSISILFGAVYASRKEGQKGWLIGLTLSVLYMFVLYLISLILGGSEMLDVSNVFRIILAALVGILSGMVGINL